MQTTLAVTRQRALQRLPGCRVYEETGPQRNSSAAEKRSKEDTVVIPNGAGSRAGSGGERVLESTAPTQILYRGRCSSRLVVLSLSGPEAHTLMRRPDRRQSGGYR